MNSFTIPLCLPLLLALPTLCPAGNSRSNREDAAVEKVVAASMEAARKGDWKAYAELVHPESLVDYRNMWLPVLRAAARKGKQAELFPLFDEAADLESVIALKPKAFFVRSMKAMASQFKKGITSPLNVNEKIIGTVHEGADRAYVVVRTRRQIGPAEMTKVEVITLKRRDAEWKMLLPEVVRIMAETFGRNGHDTQQSGPVTDRADPDK
jgi:hypothetical protein